MIRKTSILLLAVVLAAGCATNDPNQKAKQGAGAGAAAGAIIGAIIGNQGGNNRTGAVVGAAAGAAIGAAIGHRMDKQQQELQQIPGVEVSRPSEGEIAVNLTNDILFDFNSYALRGESQNTLRDLAANFRNYPDEQVTVEGHTDSVGTPSYNQTLSEQRASVVSNYLVDQGVPSSRITSIGYGETRPKASNDTPEGRQLNRRVEIHIRATQG
ncbi:MAG TPA: OmpA family protein [Thermoanaerobaculia bacterium]|jgi:outer membrane protein OmpA-like peptidoglycan-associated protein|nr:OmpA family protein [Thermoanaerobaculia bacterium]